jgi:hypothetical protein
MSDYTYYKHIQPDDYIKYYNVLKQANNYLYKNLGLRNDITISVKNDVYVIFIYKNPYYNIAITGVLNDELKVYERQHSPTKGSNL